MKTNTLRPNGRIYSHGDGVSQTISPYSPDFWLNIEEGIKPLVESFVNKMYLPYSSCAGHPRMFIALALCSYSYAENLKNLTLGFGRDVKPVIKELSDYEDSGEGDRILAQINFLNSIYMRGYNNYTMMEVTILNHGALPEFVQFIDEKVANYDM